MTSPSNQEKESILTSYPSLERFEEILAEAEMNAQSQAGIEFLKRTRGEYEELGEALELNQMQRLWLRQLSTGAVR